MFCGTRRYSRAEIQINEVPLASKMGGKSCCCVQGLAESSGGLHLEGFKESGRKISNHHTLSNIVRLLFFFFLLEINWENKARFEILFHNFGKLCKYTVYQKF